MTRETDQPKIRCARCGKELAVENVKHGPFPDHMMPMCSECASDGSSGGW